MFESLRLRIIEPLTVGGYLVLIVIGIELQPVGAERFAHRGTRTHVAAYDVVI